MPERGRGAVPAHHAIDKGRAMTAITACQALARRRVRPASPQTGRVERREGRGAASHRGRVAGGAEAQFLSTPLHHRQQGRYCHEHSMAIEVERDSPTWQPPTDGAADNWTFLETLSPETEVIDFWHACEHLRTASDHAVASDWFERYREVLRHDPCGVDKVIRALRHLRDSAKPDRAEIERELAFFSKHRQRMLYHALKAEGVAIGSGVVEAANKALVTQRMKRSGMRWRIAVGQAELTFRALIKSARFNRAWKAIIGATNTPANDNINPCAVIAIAA